jgi:hypothetical protein
MRELTFHDLDAELAEQLPARELMGASTQRCGCYQPQSHPSTTVVAHNQTAYQQQNVGSNYQANGNGNKGISIGDGALSGNSIGDVGVQVGNVSVG